MMDLVNMVGSSWWVGGDGFGGLEMVGLVGRKLWACWAGDCGVWVVGDGLGG